MKQAEKKTNVVFVWKNIFFPFVNWVKKLLGEK